MRFGSIEEFHGLKFETTVSADTGIAAVIGRNGAGKTRLLRAIAEGKIKVLDDLGEIPQGRIRLQTLAELQPESARDLWRLQPLRRWSHEQVEQVLT